LIFSTPGPIILAVMDNTGPGGADKSAERERPAIDKRANKVFGFWASDNRAAAEYFGRTDTEGVKEMLEELAGRAFDGDKELVQELCDYFDEHQRLVEGGRAVRRPGNSGRRGGRWESRRRR
jgi:hypothetical protein